MLSQLRSDLPGLMERELHDLCQPLTSLQCRLELAQLKGDLAELREAVAGGLEDTARLFAAVARMRQRLQVAAAKEACDGD